MSDYITELKSLAAAASSAANSTEAFGRAIAPYAAEIEEDDEPPPDEPVTVE